MRLCEIESSLAKEIQSFPFLKKNFQFDSSTLNFQNQTGIKVAQYYKMPEGLSVQEVYRYLNSLYAALDRRQMKSADVRHRVESLYDSIEKLNPELASINQNNVRDAKEHILTAVLSLFPINDIESYVGDGKTGTWYLKRPDWPERYNKISQIEKSTGAGINWIPSPDTLDRIYKQVIKKQRNAAPRRLGL